MTHRLPLATALRDVDWRAYFPGQLRRDVMSGITVGIVAIPLAMALAIASGVPPQHGLYTSIVAGIVIAACGGSPVNISGPTAAFVVILLPISQQFGVAGLMLASLMAGFMLLGLGAARAGRFIRLIPHPVTAGFTAGIGVVIAALQLNDLLGLEVSSHAVHFLDRLRDTLAALGTVHWPDLAIAALTLLVLRTWPSVRTHVPSHLVALAAATLAAWLAGRYIGGFSVATIGTRFEYAIAGDAIGHGIPGVLPGPAWPWSHPGPEGSPLVLSWSLLTALVGPAFTIAMLGAIESLLCGVVSDGMAGTRHDPDAELVGQGIGNCVAPFLGGIAATAALARTATNVRAGGRTPVAGVVHGLVILVGVLTVAPLLSMLPMAALSAMLLVVAWHMAELRSALHMLRISPRGDVLVMLVCFACTVIFDMVVAVAVGLILAAGIFIRRMIELTGTELLGPHEHEHLGGLPDSIAVYDVDGPLFFGAADKAVATVSRYRRGIRGVVLDFRDVPMMDLTGLLAVRTLLEQLRAEGIAVIVACVPARIAAKLSRAGLVPDGRLLYFCDDYESARQRALEISADPESAS